MLDEVVALTKDWRGVITDPAEYAMLEFSEQVVGDAWKITESEIEKLRMVGFSDLEILEIVGATTYRVYISKFADALGVELDDHWFTDRSDAVEALSVGRPALKRGTD